MSHFNFSHTFDIMMRSIAQIEVRAIGSNLDVLNSCQGVPITDHAIYKIATLVSKYLIYSVDTRVLQWEPTRMSTPPGLGGQ